MTNDLILGVIIGVSTIFSLFGVRYLIYLADKKDFENHRLDKIAQEIHEIRNQLKMRI